MIVLARLSLKRVKVSKEPMIRRIGKVEFDVVAASPPKRWTTSRNESATVQLLRHAFFKTAKLQAPDSLTINTNSVIGLLCLLRFMLVLHRFRAIRMKERESN